jgi:RNA polymerase sigma factor (sigma-70 family)
MGTRLEARDRHLAELLATGGQPAVAQVYGQFSSVVFGVALRVTGDRDAAEDVVQAVFLRLCQNPDGFDPDKGALRPWLVTLAHHQAVDWVRREDAVRRRAELEDRSRPTQVPDTEETVETALETERLRRVLESLPEGERAPIRLAYFGGRTYRQVAIDLDLPEGTVKSRIRSGLRHMADVMHSGGRSTAPSQTGHTLLP